ncbi:MAG: DUF2760 domain-containing protein [Desulfobacterales bacterium]|nr:DUF2760 domain-containing protein [Desulfobacterales bacterium]
MDTVKPTVRPMVIRVALFNLLACLVVDSAAFWALRVVSFRVAAAAGAAQPGAEVVALDTWMQSAAQCFWPYFVPASVLCFALIAVFMVLSLRRGIARAVPGTKKAAPKQDESSAELERQALQTRQRLYLHLVTVLQKEGRLLDFFSEDLSQYNDAQIGAAVRDIHHNCKKALEKHVAPQAVLAQNEGDPITVEEHFDPNTIKLIGNVTGRPPFKGVVQHRGWRAGKLELPTFPGRQVPEIIAPAEVEIG